MRTSSALFLVVWLFALCAFADEQYQVTKKIPVAGQGSWDYLTVDEGARRLYVSHGTQVEVLDLDSGAPVGKIENTLGVHGIAVAPELGRGFITNGQASTVTIFDLKTLRKISDVPTGKKPDAIIYDSATSRVFAFNGQSDSATVINAKDGSVAGTVNLGGGPEFAASDAKRYAYNNIEFGTQGRCPKTHGRSEMEDLRKKTACMLIDRENLRLFVGCRSRVMTVMNIETGQVITMLLVGDHVDATAHDPATKLILNSNAEGTATVIRRETPDKYSMLETVKRCRKQKPWRSILRPTSCTCLQANIVSSKCWF